MIFGIKTKQKKLFNAMFFFFFFFCGGGGRGAKFPERCGYFELKRNKCNVPVISMTCLC